jgi:hypothetical protein
MKKTILLSTFCFLLVTLVAKAQIPPNAFNYSAVARNASGQPIAIKTIGIQISILKTSSTGAVQYSENHFVNTDAYGLFNLVIGAGAVQSGTMAAIDWGNDNYYLKVGMDANGGTNFLTMGTTQLLSVPYALYAKSAGNTINQTISRSNDTIFLSGGGFVKLPLDGDTSKTNELQLLSISNDTIFLSGGGFVKLPSNNGSSTPHYIGEQFGGGVIFYLWKDSAGVEHGLIVDKTGYTAPEWSNIYNIAIGPSASSSWDGLSNSNAIVGQAGHTNSAAALCLNSTNGGKNDWYLPSIDELSLLWQNRFIVNKSLSTIGGAIVLDYSLSYWSSTEYDSATAGNFSFNITYLNNGNSNLKMNGGAVRAIRAF